MDVKDVIATVKNLMDDPGFRKRNEVMQNRRDLRYAEQAVGVKGIETAAEYRTGLIDENIYHYQTTIRQATFLVRTFPNSESDPDKERAKRANQACVALWADASRRTPGVIMCPLDRCADHQPGDGIGWYHEKISPTAYKVLAKILAGGKPPKDLMTDGLDGLPFIVEACDPMTMYYTPDLSMVAQVGAVKTSELLAKYPSLRYNTREGGYFMTAEPLPPDRVDRIWQSTATVYHLETADRIYDVLLNPTRTGTDQGQVLLERENIFGRPSYVPVPGRVSGSGEAYKMFQPAVVNMFRIIQQVNVAGTLQQAAGRTTGKPQYYLRLIGKAGMEPEDWYLNDDGTRKVLTIGEGEQLDVPIGFELVAVALAAGIDLIRAKADLRDEMQQVAFPLPLRQPSDVRVTSGYDRSRQEEVTSAMLGYLLRHQADAWEDLFALMAAGLRYLGVPVRVTADSGSLAVPGSPAWWLGERRETKPVLVRPEDFEGVDMQAEMSSLSRSAWVAMQEEGGRMAQAGRISDIEDQRDFRGVDDPEETLKAIDRSFVRRGARESVRTLVQRGLETELGVPPTEIPGATEMPARVPAGMTSPGAGATLSQPANPGPTQGEPGLPGATG